MPVIHYGDVLYMNASAHCLHMLDSVYQGALRFITNCGFLTHHCVSYSKVKWSALGAHCINHCYVFIYESTLGKLPVYLSSL